MHGQTPRGAMELERRREGAVEILTLNRPAQRNALNPELIERLSTALTDTRSDDSVHAIVLTGANGQPFSGGASAVGQTLIATVTLKAAASASAQMRRARSAA